MTAQEIVRAWGRILQGKRPSLSIEITRECPLHCPGCYAYEPGHPGEGLLLRELADYKGDALVANILRVVDERRPLHLSLVGGDPLVRYRELDKLLPRLEQRGIHVQVVTSAFREIPKAWAALKLLRITVSVDGLQPEHDARRRPATYERILKNITGHCVNLHCTITAQMMQRRGYLEEFMQFWSPRTEVNKVWFSMFTPQKGASGAEVLSRSQREYAVEELLRLRSLYPKLDLAPAAIRAFLNPPASPEECIFATTTEVLSADLKTRVTPCQFGGTPDCSQCGCVASMGMAAVGSYRLGGVVRLQSIYNKSWRMGQTVARLRTHSQKPKVKSRAA
jgi:MoaA/NifB/PqqE/SkfB family radical SAM enzyme